MTKFQLILTMVFGAFIIIGVIFFSLGRSGSNQAISKVLVWGYLPENQFQEILKQTGVSDDKNFSVTYEQIDRDNFDDNFVNALADGYGPDVLYIGQDQILKQKNRLALIPYEYYPLRNFQNTFTEGTEIMLADGGIRAIPITVDPLVLYWNRDTFAEAGLVNPPKNWPELTYEMIFPFTKKDGPVTLLQSAIPLGTWSNLNHAKGILSALIMQSGGNVTSKMASGVVSALGNRIANGARPAESALNFFVDFSNPQTNFYTWNGALSNSIDYFASGRSAMYIGLASDLEKIKQRNPNLNFDVTELPQSPERKRAVTYGEIMSLAIPSSTSNFASALNFINAVSTKEGTLIHSRVLGSAPSRKDALLEPDPANAFESVFFNSAKYALSWLDPDKTETDNIFSDMIKSVTSGQKRISDSVSTANQELVNILK